MNNDNNLLDLDLSKLDLRKIQTCTLPVMVNEDDIHTKEDE